MTRDHMMGFIQPNEETDPHQFWEEESADPHPLGYPTNAQPTAVELRWAEAMEKRYVAWAFERDDHQPDGTVRPAKAAPAGAHMSTWFFGGFGYVHLHGTNAVTVTRIA